MVGCAFVEFKKVEDAGAAIKAANASQFLGRTIAVDWAVPKEVFKENKADVDDTDVTPSKEIEEDPKSEQSGDSDDDDEAQGEDTPMEESEDSDDEDESCEEEEETGIHDNSVENEDKMDVRESVKPHNLKTGHDVGEGKTVFIRNLSYDTDQEDLRDLMEEYFGGVVFAKLVMDKEMGHPRGTAFVKFKKREFAEKCVEVGEGDDGVYLDNRKLTIMMVNFLLSRYTPSSPSPTSTHFSANSLFLNLTKAVPLGCPISLSITSLANTTPPKYSSIRSLKSSWSE